MGTGAVRKGVLAHLLQLSLLIEANLRSGKVLSAGEGVTGLRAYSETVDEGVINGSLVSRETRVIPHRE
jgi:hypothetical protein